MTADDAAPTNRRLFVVDYATKTQFLVDTGADICVIPRAMARGNREKSQYMLYAANGTEIPTYGTVTITLDLGLCRAFTWRFVVAEVRKPIIGVDFLYHYGLLVDVRNRCLLNQTTSISVSGWTTKQASSIPSIKTAALSPSQTIHSTVHYIRTTPGPPVTSKPRRHTPDRLKAAKKEFETMMQLGIV
ncbi:uncharacterized protein LOC143430482 [Xylocopa sonorina]|uniref:uncharacterized protein LOC143430482 n=1 Tax=Xylocopa sonorina TaxID=1818115 RepID=UPI00403ABEE3